MIKRPNKYLNQKLILMIFFILYQIRSLITYPIDMLIFLIVFSYILRSQESNINQISETSSL